jgi:CP family cyanate transporter-like MFS transporter
MNESACKHIAVVALVLVSLNLRTPITSISPVLEAIRHDLASSRSVIGLLTTIPVLCMGLFAPFATTFAERHGVERTVRAALLLIGAAIAARLFGGLWLLLVTAVLAGGGIAVTGPLLGAFIKQRFPSNTVLITGVNSLALAASAGLSAALTAPIRAWAHGSWRAALASWSLLALLALMVWQFVVRQAPHATTQGASERQRMPLREPRAWLLMLLFGLQSQLFYCVMTWLAPTYVDLGWSEARAGLLLSAMTVVQVSLMLFVSAAANRHPDRRPWLYFTTLATFAGLLGFALAPLSMPYVWVLLFGAGSAGLFALSSALPLDYGHDPAAAGAWTAMMLCGGYLIAATGPFFGGVIRDLTGSYAAVMLGLTVVAALLLPVCYCLGPPQRLLTQSADS